ncbi:MAG: hypothetical protein O2780_14255 [Proteobacteria bacterium]|nr:hypothetical protein [Pseudomonadota bacterium]MDA1300764.1 hypothetical protein [Pseudomonadota bacterium]
MKTSILVLGLVALSANIAVAGDPRPDLTGTYNAATLTPLQRPEMFGDKLYMSREEADEMARRTAQYRAAADRPSDPERNAPPEGGDGSTGAAGNVGGYNTFWIDNGDAATEVNGQFRTSIIHEPKNGRLPEVTAEAREAFRARFRNFRRGGNDGTAWWIGQGDGSGPYDDMEQRGIGERCLLGFGNTGGAPMMPVLYNNFKRIVQTDDHVMILVEMNHDARIVRMNSEHLPAEVRRWHGDSIGWWEGDTLVVDTTNFREEASFRGSWENLHVVERFSLDDDGDLHYEFTVDDPTIWTTAWSGAYTWVRSDEKVFEYACHEGNYALGNIMRGARLLEQDALADSNSGD